MPVAVSMEFTKSKYNQTWSQCDEVVKGSSQFRGPISKSLHREVEYTEISIYPLIVYAELVAHDKFHMKY